MDILDRENSFDDSGTNANGDQYDAHGNMVMRNWISVNDDPPEIEETEEKSLYNFMHVYYAPIRGDFTSVQFISQASAEMLLETSNKLGFASMIIRLSDGVIIAQSNGVK